MSEPAPAASPRVEAPRLLLASASPRRALLLRGAGWSFTVAPTAVEEWEPDAAPPAEIVAHNAALKAAAASQAAPDAVVLAADTTVALGDRVLHKPVDRDAARAMLRALSGREHSVYTAVAVRHTARNFARAALVRSGVCFRTLDDPTIDAYFARVDPLDKAGAYGIQAGRELILERLDGSFTNVMGLPLAETEGLLRAAGLQPDGERQWPADEMNIDAFARSVEAATRA